VQASLLLGAGVMTFSATAFTFLRYQLPVLYTDQAQVIELAAQIFPFAAAFQLSDGTQVVAGGVLRGMGRPAAAAVVNLLGYYVAALPAAYVLGFSFGYGLGGHLACARRGSHAGRGGAAFLGETHRGAPASRAPRRARRRVVE
jgi:Na+-driven multidrug efflux pump